jgi:tetratricopeptide (TPR) repeat protein
LCCAAGHGRACPHRPGPTTRWAVCLIATPCAFQWLNAPGYTGHLVRHDYKLAGEPHVLPEPDAIIVAPGTFNAINKWAAGIFDTLALGLLCEGDRQTPARGGAALPQCHPRPPSAPNHPDMANPHSNLGNALADLGDLAGARSHYERALEIGQAFSAPDHPKVAHRRPQPREGSSAARHWVAEALWQLPGGDRCCSRTLSRVVVPGSCGPIHDASMDSR